MEGGAGVGPRELGFERRAQDLDGVAVGVSEERDAFHFAVVPLEGPVSLVAELSVYLAAELGWVVTGNACVAEVLHGAVFGGVSVVVAPERAVVLGAPVVGQLDDALPVGLVLRLERVLLELRVVVVAEEVEGELGVLVDPGAEELHAAH